MLTPITQNEGITDRERYLAFLARSKLLRLWSYPGLARREADGRSQELADLTVVFGDDVLLFSDKDEAWSDHPDIAVAWGRWYRGSVEKSAKQLWGAERYLRQFPEGVFLDAKLTEPFPFPIVTERTRIHLIAVTSNSAKAAQTYFDSIAPGSSSTLMFHFPSENEPKCERPFVIGDLNSSRTFVHVFDQESLRRVILELGTIVDLLHYLTAKVRVIRSGYLMQVAGEEELLGFYLQELQSDGYGSLPIEQAHPDARVVIPEGEWRAFESSAQYKIHRSQLQTAEWWGSLLELFSEAITSGDTGEANDVELAIHERALRVAASENRVSRAYLSAHFEEKYRSVPSGIRSSRIAPSLCVPGRVYVLVVVPFDPDVGSYAEYRAYRRSLIEAYAQVLPLKVIDVREAVIVGVETRGGHTDSEVMIYVSYDRPLDEEQIQQAQTLMETHHILDTAPNLSMGDFFSEAPTSSKKYGRNAPCPCGSGRKNKKCCDIVRPIDLSVYISLISN